MQPGLERRLSFRLCHLSRLSANPLDNGRPRRTANTLIYLNLFLWICLCLCCCGELLNPAASRRLLPWEFGLESLERLDPAVLGTPDILPSLLGPFFAFLLLVFVLLFRPSKLIEASGFVAVGFPAVQLGISSSSSLS